MNIPKQFADTDLCVKCGLCLPHCPTYTKTLDENESPRGRISLIQAWSSGALVSTKALHQHLDNCLLCRTCESVCPAMVPYGKLMDQFRMNAPKPARFTGTALAATATRRIFRSKKLTRLAGALTHGYRKPAMQTALRITGLRKLLGLTDLEHLLPTKKNDAAWEDFYPAIGKRIGQVGLFIGCTGQFLDSQTIDAAIKVLNLLGYSVNTVNGQVCCGALELHAGNMPQAAKLAAQNVSAFEDDNQNAVVTVATGCSAMLMEYPVYFPKTKNFAKRIIDINQFLAREDWTQNLPLKPLTAKVCLHTPCSLENVLRAKHAPLNLIRSIPELEIYELPPTPSCCGAAGSYMIEHPEMANTLRQDILDAIGTINPDYLVTSNIGCALHLDAGLRQRKLKVKVLHPISLIANQLEDNLARK